MTTAADLLYRVAARPNVARIRRLDGAGEELSVEHRRALRALLEVCDELLALRVAPVREGATDARALSELAEAARTAEGAGSFVDRVLDQRADPEDGPWLRAADRVAEDAWATAWQALRARAGAVRLSVPPIPPLAVAEVSASAATSTRDVRVAGPGHAGQAAWITPFPLLFVPVHEARAPWWWVTLFHELGHDLDAELGLSVHVARAGGPRRLPWPREVVADAIGLLFGGAAFVEALEQVVGRESRPADRGDMHPPPRTRVAVLRALHARWTEAPDPPLGETEEGEEVVRSIVDALAAPFPQLGGGTLRDLLDVPPDREASAVADAAAALRASASESGIPARRVPAACWAVHRELDAEGLTTMAARASRIALRAPARLPAETEAWELFRRRVIGTVVVDEGKAIRPDPDRLRRARSLTFVGATNGQLAGALEAAVSPEPWTSIRVYCLTPETLRAIALDEATGERDVDTRARAIDALGTLLPKVATEWAILEYAVPGDFASYWDPDRPGGWIHVKPFVPGEEIRSSAFLEVHWPEGQPDRPTAMTAHLRALAALEPRARTIASSG